MSSSSWPQRGMRVRVPTRHRERAKRLIVLPTVDVVNADVHDPATLNRLVAGTDAVISLAGILHEQRKGEFAKRPHRTAAQDRRCLPRAGRAPAGACLRAEGGARCAQRIPALQGWRRTADPRRPGQRHPHHHLPALGPLRARRPLPESVRAACAQRCRSIVLGSPQARFQPVYVEDVARCDRREPRRARTASTRATTCAGPKVYTLQQLVEYVCRVLRPGAARSCRSTTTCPTCRRG